jgi:hypothetical protein
VEFLGELSSATTKIEDAGVFGDFTQHQVIQDGENGGQEHVPPVPVIYPGKRVIGGEGSHCPTRQQKRIYARVAIFVILFFPESARKSI